MVPFFLSNKPICLRVVWGTKTSFNIKNFANFLFDLFKENVMIQVK